MRKRTTVPGEAEVGWTAGYEAVGLVLPGQVPRGSAYVVALRAESRSGGLPCCRVGGAVIRARLCPAEAPCQAVDQVVGGAAGVDAGLVTPDECGTHLVVELPAAHRDDAHLAWGQVADVLVGGVGWSGGPPAGWPGQVLARYPGCSLVAVGSGRGGCLITPRGGRQLVIAPAPGRGGPLVAVRILASFAYCWLSAGHVLAPGDRLLLAAGHGSGAPRRSGGGMRPYIVQGWP